MSSLNSAVVGILIITLGFALLTLPVMKFYARPVPLLRLYLISCWIFFRVALLILLMYIVWIWGLGQTVSRLPPLVTFAVVCLGGAQITRDLKKQGYSKPFPGIGARAIFGIVVLSWLLVGVAWLAGAFKP